MTQIPNDVLRPYRQREGYSGATASRSKDALAGTAKPEATRSIAAMVQEMDEDYQVKFGRLVLEANIKAIPLTVVAETGDERAKKLADKHTALWKRSISRMCDAISDGRVAFEKVRNFDRDAFISSYELDALPFDRTEMVLEDGCFDGINLDGGKEKIHLPAEDSWWLALDPEPMQPHGQSRYSGAARKAYLDRKETRRLRALFIQKYAIGWAKAHVQSRYKDPESGEMVDGHAKLQGAFDLMRAGGLITFDNARAVTTDGKEGGYLDDIEEMNTQQDGGPLDATLDGLDVEQLRALGIPEKTVTEGEAVGSFAMVSQQMKVLLAVVDDIFMQLAESFQRYVVDKDVEENFEEGNRPILVVQYVSPLKGPTTLVYDLAKSIVTGTPNPIVLSGGVDVPEILKQAGVPLTPEMDAIWSDPERRAKLLPAPPSPVPGAAPPFGLFMLQPDGSFKALANDPSTVGTNLSPPQNTELFDQIPSRRQMVDDALDALQDLFGEMTKALSNRNAERFVTLAEEVRTLRARMAVAGHVIGMLSPWRPRLSSQPAGHGPTKPVPAKLMALDLSAFDFPWLKSAVHFLNSKQLLSDEDFALLDQDERAKALSVPGVDEKDILQDVQLALASSVQSGEALDKFRVRIDKIISLPKAQTETLFRTQTKQAFIAGQERALANPVVAEEFPYVEYMATEDSRVRDSHWELDGQVVRRGSPEHQLFLRALSDYNCRCTIRPITAKEAEQRGIASLKDLGKTARSEYQNP